MGRRKRRGFLARRYGRTGGFRPTRLKLLALLALSLSLSLSLSIYIYIYKTQYLKSKNPEISIGLADPHGASMYNYFKNGELKAEGSSITEGIGQGRITKNVEGSIIDFPYLIDDAEALEIVFTLIEKEGLFLGLSSGINIAGAKRLAKDLGKGSTIVTILCDLADRYKGKMFNIKFLKENNLPIPEWL